MPHSPPDRDPYWDNLRWLAGSLVIALHAADTITDRDGLRWLHVATWAFRVPVLALLAGYFSSAVALDRERVRGLAVVVLLPYLAFTALHHAQILALTGGPWGWDPPHEMPGPQWTLWFLQALLVWRLALPLLARLPHPLTTSVVAALAVGYLPAVGTTPSRAITFLPFFLLGHRLRRSRAGRGGVPLADLLAPDGPWAARTRRAAWAVLGVVFAGAWVLRDRIELDWLQMSRAYGAGSPLQEPWAWSARAVILLGGTAAALSLLRLAPRRRLPLISTLGAGGMFMYLLHPLVLRPVEAAHAVDWVNSWPEQALLVAGSLALAAVLASPPVRRLTAPLVQPRRGRRPRPSAPSPSSGPASPGAGWGAPAREPGARGRGSRRPASYSGRPPASFS